MTSDFVRRRYAALSRTTHLQAKKYLLSEGYFTEKDFFPGIIAPRNLERIDLKPIIWKKENRIPRTHPIKIIGQKPNKGIREFSLMHPYIFLHSVNEITDERFWKDIRGKLSSETRVNVYTTPLFGARSEDDELGAWTYFSILDPSEFYLTHDVEVNVDIQNFYGSIYTHSIPWIVMGRERAKQNRDDYTLNGNRLDKLMQNANDGQTNGLLVGNEISNIIAELLLKDVDEKISSLLENNNIIGFRYRDDYKFLCQDFHAARCIVEELARTLNSDYGLALNVHKTDIKHVSVSAYDSSKKHTANLIIKSYENLTELNGKVLYNLLKDASNSHSYMGEKHFFDNTLKELTKRVRNGEVEIKEINEWASAIIFLIVRAIDSGVSTGTYGFGIIDVIFHNLKQEQSRKLNTLMKKLIRHYQSSPSILIKLWLYMIILNNKPEMAEPFLAREDSEIFMMAKNASTADARFFLSRDVLSQEDKLELDKFQLLLIDRLEELAESEDTIIDTIDQDDFDDWVVSYYDF